MRQTPNSRGVVFFWLVSRARLSGGSNTTAGWLLTVRGFQSFGALEDLRLKAWGLGLGFGALEIYGLGALGL